MDPVRDTAVYLRRAGALGRVTFELERVRYRVDLDAYRLPPWLARAGDPGPRSARALAAARGVPVAPAGLPGIFAANPGAHFDRVIALERGTPLGLRRWLIIAQDRRTGALHGWTISGTVESALPPGAQLLAGRRRPGGPDPLFADAGRLYFARDPSASPGGAGPLGRVEMPAVFGQVRDAVGETGWLVTVEAGGREIAVYDATGGSKASFRPGNRRAALRAVGGGAGAPAAAGLGGFHPPLAVGIQ